VTDPKGDPKILTV